MFHSVLTERSRIGETFIALLTLERFFSGVGVHVNISYLFVSKHFGTEIAFELWWEMDFAVLVKGVLMGKRFWTLFACKCLFCRARRARRARRGVFSSSIGWRTRLWILFKFIIIWGRRRWRRWRNCDELLRILETSGCWYIGIWMTWICREETIFFSRIRRTRTLIFLLF